MNQLDRRMGIIGAQKVNDYGVDYGRADHIEVWFDGHVGAWCGDAVDSWGDYLPMTAEWSATRKLAIERSACTFPDLDIQVYSKGECRLLRIIKGDN